MVDQESLVGVDEPGDPLQPGKPDLDYKTEEMTIKPETHRYLTGTLSELRKKPPKSMKGMITTGAMPSATSTLGEMQDKR